MDRERIPVDGIWYAESAAFIIDLEIEPSIRENLLDEKSRARWYSASFPLVFLFL